MLNKSDLQKTVATWAGVGLVVAGVLFIGLMISTAAKAGESNSMSTLAIGPLKLVELGRQQIDGQTAAVIHYLPGLIYYFISALFLGAALGFTKAKFSKL